MRVTFVGSGDAFGSGGRFNTCILVEAGATRLLVDCGATSLVALRRLGIDPNTLDAVVVSHLHGDHFGGLPFLLLDAQLVSRRARPLTLAGPPGFAERLDQAREVLFPRSSTIQPAYPLRIVELREREAAAIGEATVTPYPVAHFCAAPPFALRLEGGGRSLCYTGDTEWTPSLLEAAGGVDLLIAEAYFFDRKVKWHLDYATLARHLPAMGARRVVLTHMSADMLARAGEAAGCELAEDGKVFEV